MDVTLIVKASNQQCEDLTIKCEPSWTIRRLKGHLTEVYPGKPSTDEQKLIYSGQLLGDSVVLKDVLRQYDGQQAHTVHLVFTPKNSYYGGSGSGSSNKSNGSSKMTSTGSASPAGASNSSSSSGSGTSNASGSANSSTIMPNTVTGTSASIYGRSSRENANDSEEMTGDGGNGDGLRHRSVPQTRPAPRTTPRPSQFVEQTAALHNFMQQTYMQYLNQYINLINEQTNAANALYSASGLPGPTGAAETATPTVNQLSGAQAFPTVPFVPMVQQAPAISGASFPNLAYYPCMTSAPYTGGLPSTSNIPTPITSTTTTSAGPSGTIPSALLPPSSSGSPTATTSSTPSVPAAGALVDSSSTAVPTPGADAANAAPQPAAEQGGAAGQDVAAGQGAAAAPARARRFPNIVVEEQENNDWLDVFFSMCRVGILITVIYLYSSPMRCLTVLFIGVMLYLKKHLDRVYQAIDRRIPRLQQPVQGERVEPQPAVVNNNNVPEDHNPEMQQPPQAQSNGQTSSGSSEAPSNAKTERSETENAPTVGGSQEGSSTSSRAIVPRPRTGPAATAASAAPPAVQLEEQQQQLTSADGDAGSVPAEQPAAEGQRMTLNDMTSFLGTLVITFFTSIIPDTPAA
uniref:Ubiquitin-like domain-containing protein n=1 Tax=Anopheles dirus TaxID=7168 RepID=A0A182MZ87_9DIPT